MGECASDGCTVFHNSCASVHTDEYTVWENLLDGVSSKMLAQTPCRGILSGLSWSYILFSEFTQFSAPLRPDF